MSLLAPLAQAFHLASGGPCRCATMKILYPATFTVAAPRFRRTSRPARLDDAVTRILLRRLHVNLSGSYPGCKVLSQAVTQAARYPLWQLHKLHVTFSVSYPISTE